MEFRFSEEQLMIRDTAEQFLAAHSDSAAVRSAMGSDSGFDEELWRKLCSEMCWSAIHIPERYGGLGLGYVELAIVLEQMGRRLLCAPFFSSVCLGANALLLAGSEAQKQHWLPQIADGSLRATLAWCDGSGQWDEHGVSTICEGGGENFLLSGDYRYVVDGHSAGLLIVAARAPGSTGAAGISLFAVAPDTPGISRKRLPTIDQTRRLAALRFEQVRLDRSCLLGEVGGAWPTLEKALQLAAIALAAEQVGGAQQVLDMSVSYTRERVQFGRPVAGFQAVKHKAADMMLKAEASKSAVCYAACVAQLALEGEPGGAELGMAASIAKAYCSEAYFYNAGSALQLHGGVGFTWEYDVHLYFKRARASENFLGDAALHRERIARELPL